MEELLLRTERATLQKIYGFPEFSNTLEFLTMLALSIGRLLKVPFRPYISSGTLTFNLTGWHPGRPRNARQTIESDEMVFERRAVTDDFELQAIDRAPQPG